MNETNNIHTFNNYYGDIYNNIFTGNLMSLFRSIK